MHTSQTDRAAWPGTRCGRRTPIPTCTTTRHRRSAATAPGGVATQAHHGAHPHPREPLAHPRPARERTDEPWRARARAAIDQRIGRQRTPKRSMDRAAAPRRASFALHWTGRGSLRPHPLSSRASPTPLPREVKREGKCSNAPKLNGLHNRPSRTLGGHRSLRPERRLVRFVGFIAVRARLCVRLRGVCGQRVSRAVVV